MEKRWWGGGSSENKIYTVFIIMIKGLILYTGEVHVKYKTLAERNGEVLTVALIINGRC